MSIHNIPQLNLNDFKNGDLSQKLKFINDIGKGFEETGFIAVKNHSLENELIEKLYHHTKLFFDMPEEVKKKYEIEGLAGQRGYTSFGVEHAKGKTEGDLKEFWHFGQEVENENPLDFNYPENLIIEEDEAYNNYGMKAFRALEETGKYILRAIALYLELDEFYFDDKIVNGNSILRPIHYGPIHTEPKGAVRAGEHEDINLITLLMGASAEGLEILTKKGEWLPITALPEQIVINVGDMLQRLTNDKLRSTTHRVVNPPREKWGTSRYSIPFFLHPRSEVKLNCLENCISADNPKKYDNITAGDFLIQRLKEIGLKK